KIYEESLKEGTHLPAKVPEKFSQLLPQVGEIREVWNIPPERFIIIRQVEDGLFFTVPMSSYLLLLPPGSPIYELKRLGLRLGVVPTWDYLREEFIKRYTSPIGRVPQADLSKIEQWVRSWREDSAGYAVRKFISLNSRIWAKWTMASLLHHADLAEEGAFQVIKLDDKTERDLEPYRVFALAAENRYFKGENFYAVLLDNGLRLYLPEELFRKRVRITIGEVVLFEGELEDTRLELEGNFSGINPEEVLKVVEL
ncbi:MAG: hypothetical protein RMK21_07855, partial [Aquificaceae bacterium]|nr:hypothetical protein [Aquificaceae bacterium]